MEVNKVSHVYKFERVLVHRMHSKVEASIVEQVHLTAC